MKIGVPKEIKTNENRIALVPAGAETLVGGGPLRARRDRARARQRIRRRGLTPRSARRSRPTPTTVWRDSEMIMKVKEPIKVEWPRMRKGQLIFTYFHFAADEELTRAHIDERRDLRRVRDRGAADARAAAADADVGGRGPHGGAGGRQVPREALRRPRRAARRRPGRRAGEGRDPRRRHRRDQRGEDGGGTRREGRRSWTSRSSGCAT